MADGEKSVEEMMQEVQLLELQAKRMEKLVNQRRQERADMEAENARIQRQVTDMAEIMMMMTDDVGEVHGGDGAGERRG